MSTTYYALFHALAQCCADELIGRTQCSTESWVRVYRALNHRQAAEACKGSELSSLSIEVRNFAQLFLYLQNERHKADYDPNAELFKSKVERHIVRARAVVREFEQAPRRNRRSFAALVLFRRRP